MTEKPRPKRPAKPPAIPAAWHPAPWELPDASALQALARGEASEDQQKRALKWIIESACGTYDWSYRPGDPNDTHIALGREFVGKQIVKLIKLNLSQLRRKSND